MYMQIIRLSSTNPSPSLTSNHLLKQVFASVHFSICTSFVHFRLPTVLVVQLLVLDLSPSPQVVEHLDHSVHEAQEMESIEYNAAIMSWPCGVYSFTITGLLNYILVTPNIILFID